MKLAWSRRRFFKKAAFGFINTNYCVVLTNNKTPIYK